MSLDSIFENFNPNEPTEGERERSRPASFWIPESYHAKLEKLQKQTNKKFGKRLKRLMMTVIDRYSEPDAAA